MTVPGQHSYKGLKQYIVILLCLAAGLPLGIIGGTIYYQYQESLSRGVTNQLQTICRQHKEAIERFLFETSSALRVVTQLETLGQITQKDALQKVFNILQREYNHAFEDIGVIDASGFHVAYVGPYDLLGKNYRETAWFRETLERKIFISDVFLGFRQVPHFIIAVARGSGKEAWILRATVNAAKFASIVENVRLGRTGEAFIISREGFYQTRSRTAGQVMDQEKSKTLDLSNFEGVKFWRVRDDTGREVLRAKAWMKNNTWLLVVQQDVDDAFGELYATRNMAIFIFIIGAGLIGVVTLFTTRLLVRKIELLDKTRKVLDEQLIQSQKLASIGELSAGIAHEINNPLAVIGEEAGWMQDLLKRDNLKDLKELDDFKDSLREIGQQAGRCKEITHKLLSFARKMESVIKDVDLHKLLDDVIGMRERDANYSNISFIRKYRENLPMIYSDPSLLRQVFLNLINNAMDAIQKGGEITVETEIGEGDSVEIRVRDTGMGIPAENLGKIFNPFFTTKPPGKGTGLGLSICHGIMEKLGGNISVVSQVGKGTTFIIKLPLEKMKGAS
ncbi:MAG: two-component sensor histidine kinase [Deltaproteobacteria bacterium]|nr:two-component sensor histidine kinase [Deltaproteobacteria bacterium]